MILSHRKQLSGCHTASSPISSPLILPVHTVTSFDSQFKTPPEAKTVAKLASVCPRAWSRCSWQKKKPSVSPAFSIFNHFSSFPSALFLLCSPPPPKNHQPPPPHHHHPHHHQHPHHHYHHRWERVEDNRQQETYILTNQTFRILCMSYLNCTSVQSFCTQSNVCSRTENGAVERNQIKAFCLCHKLQENILSSLWIADKPFLDWTAALHSIKTCIFICCYK